MDQIYFNSNNSQIKNKETVALAKIMVVMAQFPEMKIVIRSHANSIYINDYDAWVLKRKAGYILEYMTDNGVDASRLSFDGFGKERAPTHTRIDRGSSKLERNEEVMLEFIIK